MTVLDKIFEHKAEEVAEAKRHIPIAEMERLSRCAGPPRGFKAALVRSAHDLALIAEIKKASPSKGTIRTDFEPVWIAQTYQLAGAEALSVLTDERFFQGSPRNLMAARQATHLPCLRKDFINDPYQIYQSRAWGADAVLLIAASLDQILLADLQNLARQLGMDALVEVHDEAELDRAIEAGADLIGVNNRDLSDLSTSLSVSQRLLPRIPGSAVAVSESALVSRRDLDLVKAAGARVVLIGTSFCAAPDIRAKVHEVMGR